LSDSDVTQTKGTIIALRNAMVPVGQILCLTNVSRSVDHEAALKNVRDTSNMIDMTLRVVEIQQAFSKRDHLRKRRVRLLLLIGVQGRNSSGGNLPWIHSIGDLWQDTETSIVCLPMFQYHCQSGSPDLLPEDDIRKNMKMFDTVMGKKITETSECARSAAENIAVRVACGLGQCFTGEVPVHRLAIPVSKRLRKALKLDVKAEQRCQRDLSPRVRLLRKAFHLKKRYLISPLVKLLQCLTNEIGRFYYCSKGLRQKSY
jgi:hypothetical protein